MLFSGIIISLIGYLDDFIPTSIAMMVMAPISDRNISTLSLLLKMSVGIWLTTF